MRCTCGFVFTIQLDLPMSKREGYAIIRVKDYRKFLKSEFDIKDAESEEARIKAIARSSKYVGAARVCPECGRLVLLPPAGDDRVQVYRIEETQEG